MRQYELAIRIAQVHHLVDERKYKKALAVIQTLDMRQVRSLTDLKVFAEVYTKTEQYDAAKATYLRIYRRSHTKRVLYRLIYLSIRTNALADAETYYQEFVRMNPNARDALILRYRIDKASGAPISQLIEILQELKQEEYIEEWAYELAKLYHRAGRREECKEECEDIILWFGTGEIVERAKILIDHLEEKDPMPYYDDKDFTVPKKEEPNPDDTGSLPDLKEFIKEQKEQKKEERRAARREERYQEEEIEEDDSDDSGDLENTEQSRKSVIVEDDIFVDDYEDDDFEEEGMDLSKKAMDGIQKLSGFLKLGKKEESEEVKTEPEPQKEEKKPQKEKTKADAKKSEAPVGFIPHSQSGTGITQDLAKEIAAIYEMEHREQLKEKAVTVLQDVPNIATNVVERMTQAVQKTSGRTYIPLDIEEIQGEESQKQEDNLEKTQVFEAVSVTSVQEQVSEEVDEETASVEEAAEEQLIEEVDEETAPAEESAEEQLIEEEDEETASVEESAEEQLIEEVEEETVQEKEPEGEIKEELSEEALREKALAEMLEQEVAEIQREIEESDANRSETVPDKEEDTETLKTLLEEEVEDEEEELPRVNLELEAPEIKTVEPDTAEVPDIRALEEREEVQEHIAAAVEEDTKDLSEEQEIIEERTTALEGYQAPEIPVVETEYMEIPEITYEDLPTTRALQQSFQDVLKLIAGELDPSHFVLMGDGPERIVGVSKQIVRVMKESGYLSQGRIAKIHADQMNKMDLISFRNQLKGNCLLIEGASDLLFPTITRMFSIMEEYYGDFVVILVDEGSTLDQLFRFVPALAKKFKYIIDISKYTEKDYL